LFMEAFLPPPPKHPATDADVCRDYAFLYDATAYAGGRFWRSLDEHDHWVPWPDTNVAAEVFMLMHAFESEGYRPTNRRIEAVMDLLRIRFNHTAPDAWRLPAGYLPLRTHLLHLATLALTPHQADHFPGPVLPYAYDPAAQAPAWQSFLESTIPDDAAFVQEFAGYCLTTDVHHELSLWLVGPEGSGKSTLLHGLQTLLGPRAGELPLDALARRRLDPDYFFGKTLLVGHEPPARPGALHSLSALVSGESLSLAPPRGLPVIVQAHAKVALAFQAFPSPDARFSSLYRRAALVVFPPRSGGSTDHALKNRLTQEGPGLLNWALAGLRRLQQRGHFDPQPTMLAAAQRLRLSLGAPAAFIHDCCQVDPHARTQATVLHQAFVAWCRQRGLATLSPRSLAAEWRHHGFERTHSRNGSIWWGVALLPHIEASLTAGAVLDLPIEHSAAQPALPQPSRPEAAPASPGR
jgi:P4 family phage/plasmid primase-like protien